MTTIIKTKPKNIDKYREAANITEYHIMSKLIFLRLIILKFMKKMRSLSMIFADKLITSCYHLTICSSNSYLDKSEFYNALYFLNSLNLKVVEQAVMCQSFTELYCSCRKNISFDKRIYQNQNSYLKGIQNFESISTFVQTISLIFYSKPRRKTFILKIIERLKVKKKVCEYFALLCRI